MLEAPYQHSSSSSGGRTAVHMLSGMGQSNMQQQHRQAVCWQQHGRFVQAGD